MGGKAETLLRAEEGEAGLRAGIAILRAGGRFFPGGSDSKESICTAGDPGLIPGSERSGGEGKGYPLQYSCLGNPTGRGGC